MTNTVPVLIEELEGDALDYAIGELSERIGRPIFFAGSKEMIEGGQRALLRGYTEGPTVQVPASLVGGE